MNVIKINFSTTTMNSNFKSLWASKPYPSDKNLAGSWADHPSPSLNKKTALSRSRRAPRRRTSGASCSSCCANSYSSKC